MSTTSMTTQKWMRTLQTNLSTTRCVGLYQFVAWWVAYGAVLLGVGAGCILCVPCLKGHSWCKLLFTAHWQAVHRKRSKSVSRRCMRDCAQIWLHLGRSFRELSSSTSHAHSRVCAHFFTSLVLSFDLQLLRNILATNPRVTKFKVDWSWVCPAMPASWLQSHWQSVFCVPYICVHGMVWCAVFNLYCKVTLVCSLPHQCAMQSLEHTEWIYICQASMLHHLIHHHNRGLPVLPGVNCMCWIQYSCYMGRDESAASLL